MGFFGNKYEKECSLVLTTSLESFTEIKYKEFQQKIIDNPGMMYELLCLLGAYLFEFEYGENKNVEKMLKEYVSYLEVQIRDLIEGAYETKVTGTKKQMEKLIAEAIEIYLNVWTNEIREGQLRKDELIYPEHGLARKFVNRVNLPLYDQICVSELLFNSDKLFNKYK